MKKLAYLGFVLAVLGLIITGCEKMHSPVEAPGQEQGGAILWLPPDDICGQPTVKTLYAGQTIDVGEVTAYNDGDYLYVTYATTGDWCMTETHLHVATSMVEIPQKNGNPIPGQFDYKTDHDPCATEYTYEIKLVDAGFETGDPLYIAAHAAVQMVIEEAPYYASTVVESEQGLTKGGGPVRSERSVPEQGLEYETGRDESNFFSLGFGGSIIVEFECPIRNGEGDDVKVIEDTWGTYPLEEADVSASQDGVNWTYLGTADNLTRHEGGIHTIATFDLGDLESAKYIKIVDVCDPDLHNDNADGYDLNAVTALQDCVQEETAWGDGEDFPGKNWATYFTHIVQECECTEWIVYGTKLGSDGDIYQIDLYAMTATFLYNPGVVTGSKNYPNANAYDPDHHLFYFGTNRGDIYYYDFDGHHYKIGSISGKTLACGSFYDGKYYCIPQSTDDLYEVTPSPFSYRKFDDVTDGHETFSFGDFAITSEGLMYGSANVSGGGGFFTYDLSTKRYTYVASRTAIQLAFGSDGTLYGHAAGTGMFYTVDPATGAQTEIGCVPGCLLFTDLASGPPCEH